MHFSCQFFKIYALFCHILKNNADSIILYLQVSVSEKKNRCFGGNPMYSMYLTTAQHDRLQTLVSGFEIPFRSFVASEICNAYPTEASFSLEIIKRPSFTNGNQYYQTINSELGKIKANPGKCYSLLRNSVEAKAKQIIVNEIDVPNVATIIVLSVVFRELFSGFLLKYNDDNTYLCQAFKFKYVRNKLDHRGCKTLETLDLSVTLDFISNALLELRNDNSLFWEKSLDNIGSITKSVGFGIAVIGSAAGVE